MFFADAFIKRTGSKRTFLEISISLFPLFILGYFIYLRNTSNFIAPSQAELLQSYLEPGGFFDAETIRYLLILASFLFLAAIDKLLTIKILNWKKLTQKYPFTASNAGLDFTINEIEYNGYNSSIKNSIAMDDSGIYLKPVFLDKFIYKPVFIEWSHLFISTEPYKLNAFGITFGREKEMIVVETKYEKGYRLRIRKGELKIDYERALLKKAT